MRAKLRPGLGAVIWIAATACGETMAPLPAPDGGADAGGDAVAEGGGGDQPSATEPVADADAGEPDADAMTDADAGLAREAAADVVGPSVPVRLQIVNAVTSLGPSDPDDTIRICYALGADGVTSVLASLPALPEAVASGKPHAGVFVGTGELLVGAGVSLADVFVVPYVMNAKSLADKGDVKPAPGQPSASCGDLVNGTAVGALTAGVDYWKLDAIPSGTFVDGASLALVLTGCAGDVPSVGTTCGPGFIPGRGPGNGNLALRVVPLDRATPIAADEIGAQFFHASAAADAVLGPAAAHPGFTSAPGDAGAFLSISGGATVPYATGTSLVQVSGVDPATWSFTLNPLVVALASPLASINPAVHDGTAFTFFELGDPGQPPDAPGASEIRSLHTIALPNNPTPMTYAP